MIAFLESIKWYYKVIVMILCSFLATLLPLPIAIADISLLAVLQVKDYIYWYALMVTLLTISDTIFAIITYKLSNKLTKYLVRTEKRKQQIENIHSKLEKQAPFWLFVAGATPFPFTLTIYASAILEYDLKKFTLLMFVSRLVKYTGVCLLWVMGYNIIN